jgi:hypothetical protein
MNAHSDLWLAFLAHGAPLIGLVLWLTPFSFSGGGGWDFVKLFSLGLYMAGVGLVVPLVIWLAVSPGMTKTQAFSALKFHGIIALIAVGFGLLTLVASMFDPANPTMSNPPANFQAVLTVAFALSAFVLPLVELGRVVYGIRQLMMGHS